MGKNSQPQLENPTQITNRTRISWRCLRRSRIARSLLPGIGWRDQKCRPGLWPRQTFSRRNLRPRTETGSNIGKDPGLRPKCLGDGAQIDCPARPTSGAEYVRSGVPASSTARIVGDRSMWRPVARRRFHQTTTTSASARRTIGLELGRPGLPACSPSSSRCRSGVSGHGGRGCDRRCRWAMTAP
jgi:hypothetical protein